MKAEEARNLSSTLTRLFTHIKKEAEGGKTNISWYNLNEENKKQLKYLGYEVEFVSVFGGNEEYYISWEEIVCKS